MQGSVTLYMDATPQRVWSLVSDVTNTGRFSPETFEAEWLDGASAPALGARFRGHVRRNGKRWLVYWTKCVVTRCEPGRDFAFEVELPGGSRAIEWGYRFEPKGEGTDVTETFKVLDYLGSSLYTKLADTARTRTNVRNMRATLERIKAVAEADT
jgi:hypothetical protein